jgi:hypothetical protein
MTDRIRILKHEAVPNCGRYDVRFADGRESRFFSWDPSRRLCEELLTHRRISASWPISMMELSAISKLESVSTSELSVTLEARMTRKQLQSWRAKRAITSRVAFFAALSVPRSCRGLAGIVGYDTLDQIAESLRSAYRTPLLVCFG